MSSYRIWISTPPRPTYSVVIHAASMGAAKKNAAQSPYWTGEIEVETERTRALAAAREGARRDPADRHDRHLAKATQIEHWYRKRGGGLPHEIGEKFDLRPGQANRIYRLLGQRGATGRIAWVLKYDRRPTSSAVSGPKGARDPGSYKDQERKRVAFYKRVLGDARYAERHRFAKWNIEPTVLQEPRLFPRVFPELSRADHERRAEEFARRAKLIESQHHRAALRGERAFGTHGSLISGGFRADWPEASKEMIRRLAHASSLLKDAAHAHKKATRLRSIPRGT